MFSYNSETGGFAFSIVADVGPSKKIGENSVLANSELGLKNPSGVSGIDANVVTTVIYPGSREYFTNYDMAGGIFNTGGNIPTQQQTNLLGAFLLLTNPGATIGAINSLSIEKKVENFN